jgi:hypothetical protein
MTRCETAAPHPFRLGLARAFANSAAGAAMFIPLALALQVGQGLISALIGTTLAMFAASAAAGGGVTRDGFQRHRVLPALLLGGSLVALLAAGRDVGLLRSAVLAGSAARWTLFTLELREVKRCDSAGIGLPSAATRLRLAITWLTGALIPLLVWLDVWPHGLLVIALVLTVFSQLSAATEKILHLRGVV